MTTPETTELFDGFANALKEAAYNAGIRMLDETPELKRAAQATLTDYQKSFPNSSRDDTISHLGYFATFITDLLSMGSLSYATMDAEEALSRLASAFGAAGLLAYGIKEENDGTGTN